MPRTLSPYLGRRERPIPNPQGGVSLPPQRFNAWWLLACRVPNSRFAAVELDVHVGPQCELVRSVQLIDPLRGGDDIGVVEVRKDGLPVPQLPLHLFKRRVLSQREQGGHQRISLFTAVGSPLPISPCVGAGGTVELPSVWEERLELRAGMQGRQHCLPRNVIIGAHCVHGQDCCTRVDFSCSPEDAWQSLSASTSAEAVLVRQAGRQSRVAARRLARAPPTSRRKSRATILPTWIAARAGAGTSACARRCAAQCRSWLSTSSSKRMRRCSLVAPPQGPPARARRDAHGTFPTPRPNRDQGQGVRPTC